MSMHDSMNSARQRRNEQRDIEAGIIYQRPDSIPTATVAEDFTAVHIADIKEKLQRLDDILIILPDNMEIIEEIKKTKKELESYEKN